MQLTLNPDQTALRDTVRAFLANESPITDTRAHLETQHGAPASIWALMSQLGWPSLLRSEHHGGSGRGAVEAVVVAEELGTVLHGGPMFATGLLGARAATILGSESAFEPGTAIAVAIGTGVETPSHRDHPTPFIASQDASGFRVNGVASLVIDGHTATKIMVPARFGNEIRGFLVEGSSAAATHTPALDLTRKFATVTLYDCTAQPLGPDADQFDRWSAIGDFGALLIAAELLGVAQRAQNVMLEYAQAREVFGKPLSKYQVTRHTAVDLLRGIELARVAVLTAAVAVDQGMPDAAIRISMAKAQAGEMAIAVGAHCVQLHGAMGYTWDCDAHLFLRRAKSNDMLFGSQQWHRNRVAENYFARL